MSASSHAGLIWASRWRTTTPLFSSAHLLLWTATRGAQKSLVQQNNLRIHVFSATLQLVAFNGTGKSALGKATSRLLHRAHGEKVHPQGGFSVQQGKPPHAASPKKDSVWSNLRP